MVSGCAPSVSIPFYKHPEHGLVHVRTDVYQKDLNSCQEEIYGKGVQLNGYISKDVDEVEAYATEYFSWKFRAIQDKQRFDRAVAAGVSAGGGYGYSNSAFPDIPEKYQGIAVAEFLREKCMNDKNWKYITRKSIPRSELGL